jgi:vacuolar-type H+-ATPase subunit E/Vma4
VPDADDRVLLAEVQGQADAEREKVLAEGRSHAAAVRAKADEEIRRLEAGQARLLERRLAVDRDRILGEARLAAGERELAAGREWMSRAFQAARSELAARTASPEYGPTMRRLLRDAAAAAGIAFGAGAAGAGADCELCVCEADADLARRLVRELGLACRVRAEGGQPGTAIALSPGRRVDNSLAARLTEAERSMEQEVARLLFGALPG